MIVPATMLLHLKKIYSGDVKLYRFKRCIGMDTVPSVDKAALWGYPTSFFECDAAKHSMDNYEILQQERLRQRKSELDELKPAPTHG